MEIVSSLFSEKYIRELRVTFVRDYSNDRQKNSVEIRIDWRCNAVGDADTRRS